MMTVETLFLEIGGLRRDDLERWIANEWVRPEGPPDRYLFHEIDVARIRLILELREQLEIAEPAMPTVLQLIDQIYELRRRMRALNAALRETLPPDLRARVFEKLLGPD